MERKVTVKEIVHCWEKGGLDAVKVLLEESKVYEDTWEEKIKNLLEDGKYDVSVNDKIALIAFNLNLKNKLYNKKENGNKKTIRSN